MLYPRLMSNWWNFIKRSITVKCGFWMSIYCFHSCHGLVLILLSHPSSNSMLVLILLSQAASMLLLISLTHSACLSCAITGWLYDSLDTYFVTRPPVLRGWKKIHMIRILKLCTNVGLNVFIQSMIVGFASPKKGSETLFSLCRRRGPGTLWHSVAWKQSWEGAHIIYWWQLAHWAEHNSTRDQLEQAIEHLSREHVLPVLSLPPFSIFEKLTHHFNSQCW